MKAKFVTFHDDDDDDCGARLSDGFCSVCQFSPDMQSLSGAYFCPTCDVELVSLKCPTCNQTFTKNRINMSLYKQVIVMRTDLRHAQG